MKRNIFVAVIMLYMLVAKISFAEIFAGYDQFCGVPVIVQSNPQGAVASRDTAGNPIIYIDPTIMGNWTMSRMFTLAHECAHHKLGHSTPQGMWWRNSNYWSTRAQELEADCWAAQELLQIGDVADLRRTIVQFASQGPMPPGNYPSGTERAMNAARCAGMVARVPCKHQIPCSHPAHPYDTLHQFDFGPWGPAPCAHTMPCQHPMHAFDTVHEYDEIIK
jgi:hypothetical protein